MWSLFGCLVALLSAAAATSTNSSVARFWIDEAFFSAGETQIMRELIRESEGRMVISGEARSAFMSMKGSFDPEQWDFYWTVRRLCNSVLNKVSRPKKVSCVPGVESISLKAPLVRTMQQAYGDRAFEYIPRSYLLPQQYWFWRNWVQKAKTNGDLPWILKANIHRGVGVFVEKQNDAINKALEKNGKGQSFVLVQSFVQNQFLYKGRPSYARVWIVVTSVAPLRAYIFKGGVVIFGQQIIDSAKTGKQHKVDHVTALQMTGANTSQTTGFQSHVVNLWTMDRNKSDPWSLDELKQHISDSTGSSTAYDKLWAHMKASIGMVLAAGTPKMRAAVNELQANDNAGFEVLGIDFLVNSTFHPTLVEVNAIPSMSRKNKCPNKTEECLSGKRPEGEVPSFDRQKENFFRDLLHLLGLPVNAPSATAQQSSGMPEADVLRSAAAMLEPFPANYSNPLTDYMRARSPAAFAAASSMLPSLQTIVCDGDSVEDWLGVLEAPSSDDVGAPRDGKQGGKNLLSLNDENHLGRFAANNHNVGRLLQQLQGASCGSCISLRALHMLADTETELARLGDFDPIFPMQSAYKLNKLARANVSAEQLQRSLFRGISLERIKHNMDLMARTGLSTAYKSARFFTTDDTVLASQDLTLTVLDKLLIQHMAMRKELLSCGITNSACIVAYLQKIMRDSCAIT